MSPDPLVKDFFYPADLKPSGGQSDTLFGFRLSFSIRTNQSEAQILLNIRLYKKKKLKIWDRTVIVNTYLYPTFLLPRQIYLNVVVADKKALATSATTHISSSYKLTISTSIIFSFKFMLCSLFYL